MQGRSERGQSLILLAVSLTAMLGFLALTVDVGRWCVARQKAVNACDMAVLGGIIELSSDQKTAERAQRAVLSLIDANNSAGLRVEVSHTVGPNNPDILIAGYNDTVTKNATLTQNIVWRDSQGQMLLGIGTNRGLLVRGKVMVPPVFGRILGYNNPRAINARAVAAQGDAYSALGTMQPFGVSKGNIANAEASPSDTVSQVLTYRQWQESWTETSGAFGTLAPGGQGATGGDDLRVNIAWGFPGSFKVGDYIQTANGATVGPVQQGLTERLQRSQFTTIDAWLAAHHSTDSTERVRSLNDARVVLFPVVDPETLVLTGNGTATSVQISGFATYALSDWNDGLKQVSGYFIKSICEGSVGDRSVDSGTLAFRLL